MKPLLIGQAPGPNTNPDYPLFPVPTTSAGGRLQTLMGITRGEYLKRFDRVNVLRHFPGKHKRDDKFPMREARIAADAMRPLLAGRRVIFVGRNVANAFGLDPEWEWHGWRDLVVKHRCAVAKTPYIARAAVVPHPSGRSRWYNDASHRAEATAFWTELLSDASVPQGDGTFISISPTIYLPSGADQAISSPPAAQSAAP